MKWKQTLKNLLYEKGYYLAFAVCLAAVAISGWLFVRSLDQTDDELSVPDAVQAAVLPTLPQGAARAAADPPAKIVRPNHPATATSPEPESTEAAGKPDEGKPAPRPGAPLCRPTEGTVVQGYSMERLSYNATTRDWRTHPGMDIGAPEGSEVKAVAEGTVLSVFTDDLLGKTVTVEHAGGYVTHYANLAEEVSVSAFDKKVRNFFPASTFCGCRPGQSPGKYAVQYLILQQDGPGRAEGRAPSALCRI